jgi:hypothetical protein
VVESLPRNAINRKCGVNSRILALHLSVPVQLSQPGVMRVTFFVSSDRYYRETLLWMSGWTTPMYNRTQNENGTYNTRCLYCLLTVATAVETNEELEQLESRHVCPERALSELLAAKSAIEAHAHKN